MPTLRLLLLGLAACGGGSPLQLATGIVERAGSGIHPTHILALRGDDVAASAPIEDDGSFLLALPPETVVRLALESEKGDFRFRVESQWDGDPFEVRICRPQQAAIDLGTFRRDFLPCRPSHACLATWTNLWNCIGDDQGDDCFNCPVEGCETEEQLYQECLLANPPDCAGVPMVITTSAPPLAIGCGSL